MILLPDFEAMREILAGYAQSPGGQTALRSLHPFRELAPIQSAQKLPREMIELRNNGALELPSLQVEDLSELLLRATPEEAMLAGPELHQIGEFLQVIRYLLLFLKNEKLACFTTLQNRGSQLSECLELRNALERCLDRDGSLFDHASEELANLRRRITALEGRITRTLDGMMKGTQLDNTLQDKFVTLRNGRHVLPVRKEMATHLPGIVQDLSNTGATLFIEPSATIGFGNELARTRLEEESEVRRILRRLTGLVHQNLEAIRNNQRLLNEIDAAQAIARWAHEYNCEFPAFTGSLHLVQARHPLLERQFRNENRAVVPLDLTLKQEIRVLAITGSNTGGKTVVLKTVGLLVQLAQSGLPIPAGIESTLPLFDQVLADIGDGQSLEENLSTFSAHIARISHILQSVQKGKSLLLLDELGSGTDPDEGGALACALLEEFSHCPALTLATTHLSLVKNFIHSRPEMLNGAVRFNAQTMEPEYILDVGRPGASHALQIARQLGLPKNILQTASGLLSPNQRRLEDMLEKLEKAQHDASLHTAECAKYEKELKKKDAQLQKALDEQKQLRREMLKEAHEEAEAVVINTRKEMEKIVRTLREQAPSPKGKQEPLHPEKFRAAIEDKSRRLQEGIRMRTERPDHPYPEMELAPGQRVWLQRLNSHGVIESVDGDRKHAVVRLGNDGNGLAFTLSTQELQLPKDGPRQASKQPQFKVVAPVHQGATPHELNLVGMRVEDALQRLATYIDQSVLARLSEVQIVHGFGTGRLRTAIHEWLKNCPSVRTFHLILPSPATHSHTGSTPGSVGNGGCTIVHLN